MRGSATSGCMKNRSPNASPTDKPWREMCARRMRSDWYMIILYSFSNCAYSTRETKQKQEGQQLLPLQLPNDRLLWENAPQPCDLRHAGDGEHVCAGAHVHAAISGGLVYVLEGAL